MSKFSPQIVSKALWQMRVRKRPFVLSHGITARCNLRCRFCEYWREEKNEMSTEDIFRLLDDAKSFGIGVYNAWTAEPLLRTDLPEILHHAKNLGIITSLITNGKLLSKRVHELSELDYLSVSLEGIKTYEELRGMKIDSVIEGIRMARELGHQVLINCVISSKNLYEIEDVVRLAKDLDVLISLDPIYEVEEIDDEVWRDLRIDDRTRYRETVSRIIEMKKNGYPIINSLTYLRMIRDLKPKFKCHTSDIILHVTVDGTIVNCRVQKEPLGHVSEGLLNVWKSSSEQRGRITHECKGCLFFGYVENSLLYQFNPEVIVHYNWM